MKKIINFAKNMEYLTKTSNLMNYEQQSSNSNNYSSYQKTSSPESFPISMENGIIINYESVKYSTEILESNIQSEE